MDETPNTEIEHATVRSLIEQARCRIPRFEILGMTGTADAWLAASLLQADEAPLLVLCPDQKRAERFAADLEYYHGRPGEVFLFPQWEIGPYEHLSPHPEVEADRLAALAALHRGTARAVVLPVRALMQKVIPRKVLGELCGWLEAEEEYPRSKLLARLQAIGYHPVSLVEDRGTFSVRGDILDIFPPTRSEPVRIEFFGDYIERMRLFDPATQRSSDTVLQKLMLLPAREMVLAGEHLETFTRRVKERCDALELPRTQREAVIEEAREGILSPGRSFLLPLNYAQGLDSFFDYAPAGRWMVLDPSAVDQDADLLCAEVKIGESRCASASEPHVAGDEMYLSTAALEQALSLRQRIEIPSLRLYQLEQDHPLHRIRVEGNGDLRALIQAEGEGLAALAERLNLWRRQQWKILLVCHQRGQAERLSDLLRPHGVQPDYDPSVSPRGLKPGELVLTLGDLSGGFRLSDEKFAIITEEEIFGQRVRRRDRGAARAKALLSSLSELRECDFIVHADHGIGRYLGLKHLQTGSVEGDFLQLEYAGEDRLYVPVDRIEKVQKYIGGEGHSPRLDKMGGGAWEKAQLKARAAVEELARELLNIYARRAMASGFAYSPPDRLFKEFEAAFPYEETPDQLSAIADVIDDMVSDKPMDRLICGDVGYGKTEVAIRAAFKAAIDGKQVAVLVPTTILASQHWETFRERFKNSPVIVDMVSRFRSASEQKNILDRTAEGKVDVLIGTHRLLQRDVRFRNLGLIIVDEEQRFGVSHKERLKKMRAEVDMLTLSATPIPRTLHMSLMGMRDLSVIDTPPVDRLAIRTYVTRFDDELLREALLRELRRGGQVYFVHNRVQSISAMADFIRFLVPEAKVAVGHGQMGEKALEEVMLGFVEGRSNVLVCSTIIENGLDIPRANTIIINRADCFGLSQLYQLRGRVGRSRQRGYAYLLIPGEGTLTKDARERLRVLQELTELGAGFRVASHDLELRGAGELLGARQAGQVAVVGFEMYSELLEETIDELKGLERQEKIDPEIRLGLSAFLPEKYVADPNQRLVIYKQLAAAEDDETLYDASDELRDRFGELPEPAALLLEVMKLRVLMKRLKVELAEYDGRSLIFGFHARTPVPPEKILAKMQDPSGRYAFTPDYRLGVKLGRTGGEELLEVAKKELQSFL